MVHLLSVLERDNTTNLTGGKDLRIRGKHFITFLPIDRPGDAVNLKYEYT
jgi:hypothetical protein